MWGLIIIIFRDFSDEGNDKGNDENEGEMTLSDLFKKKLSDKKDFSYTN